ncbi:hypothetical protein P9112_011432 [Eukaryota sp. TZLM1-RC]
MTSESPPPPNSQDASDVIVNLRDSISVDSHARNSLSFYASERFLANVEPTSSSSGLGTFAGVFTPSAGNIFGVILFTRFSWATGVAGIRFASIMILLALTTTFMTALSMCSIVTYGKMKGKGGAYYVISRTLGSSIGSAVGLMFYLANVFSCALDLLGIVEYLTDGLEFDLSFLGPQSVRITGLGLLIIIAVFCFIGIKFVSLLAPFFLAMVLYSVASILFGFVFPSEPLLPFSLSNIQSNWSPHSSYSTYSFFGLLAILFPAFTDMLVGSTKSDTLKDPAKNIPTGTISAVLVTGTVNLCFILLSGTFLPRELLINERLVLSDVAFPSPSLVKFGIIFASFGSALQALSSAPRLLWAVAQDKTIPFLNIFDRADKRGEPRIALIFTLFIVSSAVMLREIDKTAPFATMAFVLCYFSINLSAATLSILKPPSFRPKFKFFSSFTCILGTFLCVFIMFSFSFALTTIVILISILLIAYINARGVQQHWGDSLKGLYLQFAKNLLLSIRKETVDDIHVKNWRPHAMILVNSNPKGDDIPASEKGLLLFMKHISRGGAGLNMLVSVVQEESIVKTLHQTLIKQGDYFNIGSFPNVVVAESEVSALPVLLQSCGIGPLSSNCVFFSFDNKDAKELDIVKKISIASSLNQSVLAFKGSENYYNNFFVTQTGQFEFEIAVFWLIYDSCMLLMMFHLMKKHPYYKNAVVRLYTFATSTDNSVKMKTDIERLLESFRLKAIVRVLELSESTPYDINRTLLLEERAELLKQLEIAKERQADMVIESSRLCSGLAPKDTVSTVASACYINQMIKAHARPDDFIIINLPHLDAFDQEFELYSKYLQALVDGIKQVLLIKGSGSEIVTDYV